MCVCFGACGRVGLELVGWAVVFVVVLLVLFVLLCLEVLIEGWLVIGLGFVLFGFGSFGVVVLVLAWEVGMLWLVVLL